MNLDDEYPELGQFFGGYFGQDLDMEIPDGGDWRDVVDLFVTVEPPDFVDDVITELDRLLATYQTDKQIREALDELGNYYLSSVGAREWVTGLRSRLALAAESGG